MLVTEIGFPLPIINAMPESLIETILIYKGIKNVAQFGGEWQP